MLDDFLLQVARPARYIGNEWNVSGKDFAQAKIRFALCFPDLYEVGMSNLGLRIIYGILNSLPDVCCERFFSCDTDMEQVLRRNHLEIYSLESKRRLQEFDIIGFSLGYELGFTNVLKLLELSGIPLSASQRDADYPLVIAGGPCALNPEPMHEFFDLFLIGEAEDLILEFIDTYRKYKEEYKRAKISKQELLFIFSQLEGVYAPSLYTLNYNPSGAVEEFSPAIKGVPAKIKKRFVKDLNTSFFPLQWLLPYIQIIHDRITLEIMRGCPNRCRFCQARSQYFPLRQRSVKNLLDLADKTYRLTGYEEISLGGLSVVEFPEIHELLRGLMGLFRTRAVGISLPSIKARAILGDIFSLIAQVKKTGLTFAPEAGSERMRKVLAKDFDEEEFFQALEQAYLSGYQHLKLYFMIGLPNETWDDLDEIIDFSMRTSELRRKLMHFPAQLNLSINTLIPKPHTPLQWFAMEDIELIKEKEDYLKNKIRNRRIKLSFHNRQMSFLEGVLSRGDRRLSQVILAAFRKDALFDAWGNHFKIERWLEAFREANVDPYFYLEEKSVDEFLPWDFIDVGISKEIFKEEFNSAKACLKRLHKRPRTKLLI